ncbi:hypothetical protein BEWA_050150 [Theileria equi strain WA]|uniref:Uncharacterized protein n=1 Tax=Theileria equi strain WA TaxID=1537102 RepID=L1LAQ3_THEEQ|nr:hypothetical protein BEWA_050150 [Theileria equi strain WA]EKX72547.1 hypothetical protein BEWA_050150 [Theileria equi strain WA]|eukprot:XP_004831999.1 hypothetical protein BEWA_050150 [Theileria equi strain WA]
MGEACTNGRASSGTISVKIDISKTDAGGGYRDGCRNIIKVKKDNTPTNSYKKYIHTPVVRSHYIDGIYYNGTRQDTIKVDDSGRYEKKVTVYYLRYDENNVLPLVVGITKGATLCEYYKKTNYFSTYQWTKDVGIILESALLKELPTIGNKLKELIVLNVTTVQGVYYANGESNRRPDANKIVTISVSPESVHTIYKKFKHAPTGIDRMRLLSTKKGVTSIPFEQSIYRSNYNEASVYYWSLDGGHTSPLLLELTSSDKSPSYYTLVDAGGTDKKWKLESGVQSNNIKEKLDEQNCIRNKAHVMDISRRGSYQCPGSCGNSITVADNHFTSYSRTLHSVSDGSFSRFKDGKTKQRGLYAVKGLQKCYVFFYPKEKGRPLLISYKSNDDFTWYRRESFNSTNWEKLNKNVPNDENENDKILSFLLGVYAPEVTVKTEHTDSEKPYTSGSFEITVKSETKTVPRTGSTYHEFKHCLEDGGYFRPYEVKFNGDILHSTWRSDILTSFTVYYSSKQCEYNRLILIKLEKKDGGSDYYTEKHTEGQQLEWIKSDKPIDPEEFLMDLYAPKREKRMQKTTSISAAKAVGLASGVAVACFVVYEGTMMLFNPQKTLFAKMTGLFVRKT